jgi:hypothetical protein
MILKPILKAITKKFTAIMTKVLPLEVFKTPVTEFRWDDDSLVETIEVWIEFAKILKNGELSQSEACRKSFVVTQLLPDKLVYQKDGVCDAVEAVPDEQGYLHAEFSFGACCSTKTLLELQSELEEKKNAAQAQLEVKYAERMQARRKMERDTKGSPCNRLGRKLTCEKCHFSFLRSGCNIVNVANAAKSGKVLLAEARASIKAYLDKHGDWLPDNVKEKLALASDYHDFLKAIDAIKRGFYFVLEVNARESYGHLGQMEKMVINPHANFWDGRKHHLEEGFDKGMPVQPIFVRKVHTRYSMSLLRRRWTRVYIVHWEMDSGG